MIHNLHKVSQAGPEVFGSNSGIFRFRALCFISYNSRGFGHLKIDFCKYLLSEYFVGEKIPILCNQENFLLRGNSYKINKNFPGFHVLINPAVKESPGKGRAKWNVYCCARQN